MDKAMVQINTAAVELGVTRQWIHKLMNAGELTVEDIDGKRFLVKDDKYETQKRKINAKREQLLARCA